MATPRTPSVTDMRYIVSRRDTLGPVWSAVPAPSFVQGTPSSYSLSAISSDPASAPITYTSVGAALPSGVTINNTTKALDYSGTGSGTVPGVQFRATSVNGAADSSAFSLMITGASTSDGQVGAYAGMNLATYPIYSIDLSQNDYVTWGDVSDDGGAIETHHVGSWWDGRDSVRMFPPTVNDRGSGLCVFNLWVNATLAVRRLNIRFEFRVGPEYCSRTNSALPKWVLVQTTRSLVDGAGVVDRPMYFLGAMDSAPDNATFRRADTLAVCPSQGTSQSWGSDNPYDTGGSFYPNSVMPFYLADSASTFNSRAVIGPSEIITVECRMSAVSSTAFPNGYIGYRVYRRNGEVFYRGCPWNRDAAATVNASYFQDIQMMGGGYYNSAPAAHPNLYTEIGGYLTLAANLADTDGPNNNGWLGPRAGFVT